MEVTLQTTLLGHQNPIYTLAMDAEAPVLYSAGNDKGVVEWDLAEMKFKRVLCNVPSSVYILYRIPDSDLLALGMRSGDIFLVDVKALTPKARLRVDRGAVFSIKSFRHKDELIAIGEDGKAYVWGLNDFELRYTFQVAPTTVRTMAVSADESMIAFGDKNGWVYLLDARDYREVARRQVHEAAVSSMLFMDDFLLTGGRDAKLYKSALPELTPIAGITPHMFTVYHIAVVGPDVFATVSRDKTLKFWNSALKLQKNISRDKGVDGHFLSINSQSYHSELGLLATAGDDKMVKIWKIS